MRSSVYYKCFTVLTLLVLTLKVYAKNLLPDGIKQLDDKSLLTQVLHIYHEQIQPADTAQGRNILAALKREARSANTPALTAACLGIEADYFLEKGSKQDSATVVGNLEQALQIALKEEHKVLMAYFEYKLGRAYYTFQNYHKGIEHLFAATAMLNDGGTDQIPEPEQYLFFMGNVYCDFHDYKKGLQYLDAASKYPSADADYAYNLYGTFGLAYFKLHQYDSSVWYSKQAMEAAVRINDSVKIGSMSGNIGAAYFEKKDYKHALSYLSLDYDISSRRQNWVSACGSLFFIARVYEQLGETGKAQQYLDKMQQMIGLYHCGTANTMYSYYEIRASLYRKTKNYEQALVMIDSFFKYNNLIRIDKNAAILKEAELKTAKELVETRMRLAEGQRRKQILVRNGVILVALLVIIIIAQLLYRLRQRQKSERNILTLQLQNAEKQLAIYVENLREKTKLIEQFNSSLLVSEDEEHRGDMTGDTHEPEKEEVLNRMKDVTLITEDAWQEFAALVNLVHKDFLVRLKKKYPNLTPGDVRLLTLIKLDFSRQEMAATLGISPDSVKKARQRVRKKLDLDEEVDIRSVLITI